MIHNIINIILIYILVFIIYKTTIIPEPEHMDMSLFAADGGNYKPSIVDPKIKTKLEELEDILLRERYYIKSKKIKERDYKVVHDVLTPPEQRVEEQQYPDSMQINIRTRGDADEYMLVGLLYNSEKNKNYQLFGRRTYPGSYEWEYYIRGKDAGGLDFKFPLNSKQEIMDDSTINIPLDSNLYTVKIYNLEQYRYNPYPSFE